MASFLHLPAIFTLPSPLRGASFPAGSRPNSLFQTRFNIKCRYAEANVNKDAFNSVSATIDVVADVKPERVVVLGGSGFVGSAICKAAVSKGIEVIGVSRSGRPTYSGSWIDQVNWVPGDVFYVNWDDVLVGATAVVSTIGGFGSEEQMQRINGDANVVAVNAAKDYGVPKFILISVHDYNLPPFLLSSGYFTGKRKAESEVLSKYPNSGIVLRPGFIYGKRRVDGFELPLDLIGEPVERIMSATENFTKPLSSLPASDLLLAPPVSVDDVALAVINGIRDDDFFGIFTIAQIKEAADKVFPYNWDFGFRRNLNERELAEVIKMLDILDGIRLSPSRLDRRWCELEGSGSFSCKSFRSFLLNNGMAEAFSPYSLIWKAKSHPEVKVLVWLVVHGKVNTSDRVQRRRPYMYLSPHWCVLCKMSEESVDHLFLQCPFSLSLWWTLLREVKTVVEQE